eukprot:Hpha_TRINITY_DN15616_c2_g2::TRINITY_DN15616_c2_g2_i1::g.101643::m.101643
MSGMVDSKHRSAEYAKKVKLLDFVDKLVGVILIRKPDNLYDFVVKWATDAAASEGKLNVKAQPRKLSAGPVIPVSADGMSMTTRSKTKKTARKPVDKFDATDQVKSSNAGILIKGDDDKEEPLEPAPERVKYFGPGYNPRKDVYLTTEDLANWGDPCGIIWPKKAIERLRRNTDVMVEHHSYGEPSEIVLPLYIYSTFMFRHRVWATWVSSKGMGGTWRTYTAGYDLEDIYDNRLRDKKKLILKDGEDTELTRRLGDVPKELTEFIKKAQGEITESSGGRDEPDGEPVDAIQWPYWMEEVVVDGKLVGSSTE